MSGLLMLLGGVLILASVVCTFIVIIDAFKNEVWKGLLAFFCSIYLLIYAFTEYDAENKALILLVMLLGGFVGGGLIGLGSVMGGHQ